MVAEKAIGQLMSNLEQVRKQHIIEVQQIPEVLHHIKDLHHLAKVAHIKDLIVLAKVQHIKGVAPVVKAGVIQHHQDQHNQGVVLHIALLHHRDRQGVCLGDHPLRADPHHQVQADQEEGDNTKKGAISSLFLFLNILLNSIS